MAKQTTTHQPSDELLKDLEKTTIRVINKEVPGVNIMLLAAQADECPAWWSPARDVYLRKFYPTESYLAGAIYSVCSRNAAYRISFTGPDKGVEDAYRLLATANLFKGWQNFVMKVSLDLLTQDNFAFIEVIRPARVSTKDVVGDAKAVKNPNTGEWAAVGRGGKLIDLTGQDYKIVDNPLDLPIGIAHLDAARCTRTGIPEYPVVYTDLDGVPHKLKWYQVITLEDFPSGQEDKYDVGLCATSRVLRLAQTLRDITTLRLEKVSGRFAGRLYLTNIGGEVIQDAVDAATAHADNRGLTRYMPPIVAWTVDPTATPAVEAIDLASLPENFNEEEANRWYFVGLSICFGVDYGFFAPLPGNKLGTSEQAEVAERQSRGKASRLFMKMMEEKFNYYGLLPRNVWMEYKEVDTAEEMERDTAAARRARTRAEMIASGEITPAMARQLAVDAGDYPASYLKMMNEEDVTPEPSGGEKKEPKRFLGRWGFGKRPRETAVETEETEGKAIKAKKKLTMTT